MSQIKDMMKRRHNYRFFKQDVYPTKEEIENLIKDAFSIVPQKNNLYQFTIDVWGPEYAKEKESLVLNTVCGYGKSSWRAGGKYEHDFETLKKIYDDWRSKMIDNVARSVRKEKWKEEDYVEFNEQVRAPYLLTFKQRERVPTENQKKFNFPSLVFNFNDSANKDNSWYIGASMFAYGLVLLANERNIDASFCKCFFWDDFNFNEIISHGRKKMSDLVFTLCLGYRDENVKYYNHQVFPTLEEIVNWK